MFVIDNQLCAQAAKCLFYRDSIRWFGLEATVQFTSGTMTVHECKVMKETASLCTDLKIK